jgi:hypothetical protein
MPTVNNNIAPMPTQNPWVWVGMGMGMGMDMGTQCRALLYSKDAHSKAKTQRLQNPNTKPSKRIYRSFKLKALTLNRESMIP